MYYVRMKKKSAKSDDDYYTLQAEVCFKRARYFDISAGMLKHSSKPIYILQCIHFDTGGYLSFEDKSPQLIFEQFIPVTDDHGNSYSVMLTHEKVEYLSSELSKIKSEKKKLFLFKKSVKEDIDKLISDTVVDLPYFSALISDYHSYCISRFCREIEGAKRPALKTAERLKTLSKKYRDLEIKFKMLLYQSNIYENIFPWLSDFKEITRRDIDAAVSSTEHKGSEADLLRNYLSPNEYDSLSTVEKYQLALDRYKRKPKTNWQIGIAYERYIGYLYEKKGCDVTYFGATQGVDDLGRDLIIRDGSHTTVIQCKYWNKNKTIHEKHIFQLFGTMFSLKIDEGLYDEQTSLFTDERISGLFITTAELSPRARLFARHLNITVLENQTFDKDYPCIKCNISRRTGEKIYHLPFDLQYDNIKIDYSAGECYVATVEEAQRLGFRRSYKWRSNN